jgi:histidine triad (HIT) family protein|tara:strand:- start:25 stop:417 length:393 start_codon:yes stop_codon:yes gene_type:complete
MTSIFTKIINGEIPCHKVAENEDFIAFLDVNPNAVGHTLVVPKQEVDKLFDLDKNTYAGLMEFSRSLAIALEKAVPCERIGMSVIGLEVPHVHIHLIPLNAMADIQFQKKVSLSKEEFERVAKSISAHLS